MPPGRVDELSGYRCYEAAQLEQARLIATLRHVGVPLTTVKELLVLDPVELAERVTAFWRNVDVSGLWGFGKEFIAIVRGQRLPRRKAGRAPRSASTGAR